MRRAALGRIRAAPSLDRRYRPDALSKLLHIGLLTLLLAFAGGAALAQTVDVPVSRSARFTGKINFVDHRRLAADAA